MEELLKKGNGPKTIVLVRTKMVLEWYSVPKEVSSNSHDIDSCITRSTPNAIMPDRGITGSGTLAGKGFSG